MKNLITPSQLAKVLTTPENLKHFKNGNVTIVAPQAIIECVKQFIVGYADELAKVLWLTPRGSVVSIKQDDKTVVFTKRKNYEWRYVEFFEQLDDSEVDLLSFISLK